MCSEKESDPPRSLSKSSAELGLTSPAFLLDQGPGAEHGAWHRGGPLSVSHSPCLIFSPGLKATYKRGTCLKPVCPWPAVWPRASGFNSLSHTFCFHCKMGSSRPAPPIEKTQERMSVRCPVLCQALGGWPRNSGYGISFLSQPVAQG